MINFNLKTLLFAVSASSVLASSPKTIEVDQKIVLKIAKDVPELKNESFNFFNIVQKAKQEALKANANANDSSAVKTSLLNVKKIFYELYDKKIKEFDDELEIIKDLDSNFLNEFGTADEVVISEKDEWKLRKEIYSNIVELMGFGGSDDIKKKLNEYKTTADFYLNGEWSKTCKGEIISCITGNNYYSKLIKSTKTWLIAIQMFEGPEKIPKDFVYPDWKPMVKNLNISEEQYKIAPIHNESLNFTVLLKNSENDIKKAEQALKTNLTNLKYRCTILSESTDLKPKLAEFLADLYLRQKLVNWIFKESESDDRLAIINKRANIFSRFIEGLIRNTQLQRSFSEDFANSIFKLNLISMQMFTPEGLNNISHKLLTLPKELVLNLSQDQPGQAEFESKKLQKSEDSAKTDKNSYRIFGSGLRWLQKKLE